MDKVRLYSDGKFNKITLSIIALIYIHYKGYRESAVW
jgi:hypothetical protein